ncbi:MAG TPA: endonuclease/exonuclease/phosphatase family protein [Alphaproteobacteria bacterium]
MSHVRPRAFRVVSYNIHSCIGSDRRASAERILHVLREIEADVVALQEVGHDSLVDGLEQFAFFEQNLAMAGVHGVNLRRGKHAFGNALFTRGDIRDFHLEDLSVTSFEPRGAIDCSIRLGDHVIRVVATHLGLYPYERREQLDRLGRVLTLRRNALTVVLGDFNIFGLERRVLRRAGAPPRLPRLRTFPARRPLMSLDRIWTLPNDQVVHSHVHRTPLSRSASDHLPIVADIAWMDEPALA